MCRRRIAKCHPPRMKQPCHPVATVAVKVTIVCGANGEVVGDTVSVVVVSSAVTCCVSTSEVSGRCSYPHCRLR